MTLPQQRLKKFSRDPNYIGRFAHRQITERALQIIATIERYRVIPTALVVRLVGGDPRNIKDHLQHLYHRGLINRFCFFGPTGRPLEFNYFLDNAEATKTRDRHPFKCKICYVGFSGSVGLRRHYDDRHTSSTRHCASIQELRALSSHPPAALPDSP